jgi:hypothetical protein
MRHQGDKPGHFDILVRRAFGPDLTSPSLRYREAHLITGSKNRLSRVFLLSSRVLLSLVAALIAVIPWSERYCALDNFPMGQDFETNLLAFLALLGLILLLAHLCRQGLAALFSSRYWTASFRSNRPHPTAHALSGHARSLTHRIPLPSSLSAAFNLPLQI